MTHSHSEGAHRQLLHIVVGGELAALDRNEFADMNAVEFVGAFPNYRAAYNAWKAASQRTVDNARMRFFIIHAHRLLDPDDERARGESLAE